jgi:hypothetical protein
VPPRPGPPGDLASLCPPAHPAGDQRHCAALPALPYRDTSAQILAWALVVGYAQQLFTRLVDQQAHTVLNTVRERKPAG